MKNNNKFWDSEVKAGYYDIVLKNGLKKNKGIQSNYHNITFNEVFQRIFNSNKNLDYACGPGTFNGLYFKKLSCGYDISRQQIEYASKNYSSFNSIFTNNKTEVNQNAPFESITVIGLIEFLTDSEIIDEINYLYELLTTEGKLIITTPNYNNLFKFIMKIRYIFGNINYEDQTINKFNLKKIKNLLNETKFAQVRVEKIVSVGLVFSIFSHKIGIFMENLIRKYFLLNSGFILIVELKK